MAKGECVVTGKVSVLSVTSTLIQSCLVLCVNKMEEHNLYVDAVQPVCALLCMLCVQIVVMKEKRGDGWMFGRSGNEQGLFPSSYVELLKDR